MWGRWLMTNGRQHGLRPPTEHERVRASGLHPYLDHLGLQGRALYDAVGTHFDPRSLELRLMPLLRAWFGGGEVARPRYLDPMQILAVFDRLHAAVRRACPFAPLVRSPFRPDVTAMLVGDGLLPAAAQQGRD